VLALTATTAAQFDSRSPTPVAERRPEGLTDTFVQVFTGAPDGERVFYVTDGRLRELSATGDEDALDIPLRVDPQSLSPGQSRRTRPQSPWSDLSRGRNNLDSEARETDRTLALMRLQTRGIRWRGRFARPSPTRPWPSRPTARASRFPRSPPLIGSRK
jgi:hypothetical protein